MQAKFDWHRYIRNPLSIRNYCDLVFCVYAAEGAYHFRIFGPSGPVWDSGGRYPMGWSTLMEANTAITTWIKQQQNRGNL